jgi:uncharacterized RDD family membrane protein YckC
MITISDSDRRILIARIAAHIIDSIIIWVILALIIFFANLPGVFTTCLDLLSPAYFIYFHAKSGQTIGKQLFYIRVVDVNSLQKISVLQAIKRQSIWLLYVMVTIVLTLVFPDDENTNNNIGFVITFLLFVSILVDKNYRGLHDKIGGTIVKSAHDSTKNSD